MEFETPLCELAYKYGTDKCPQINHNYTPFYYKLLGDKRESIRKVVELGVGFPGVLNSHGVKYHTGASLYMWRDFFPNAMIYGADIAPKAIFKDDRIETFLCNVQNPVDLVNLIRKTGSDVDLFIDDAFHKSEVQIFNCLALMPLLKRDVIYIIEDVLHSRKIMKTLDQYVCERVRFCPERKNDCIIIVRNKTS